MELKGWMKSSYSKASDACVEARPRNWRKSSFSAQNGACVEVATDVEQTIDIRDSKNPGMPVIPLAPSTFGALLNGLR